MGRWEGLDPYATIQYYHTTVAIKYEIKSFENENKVQSIIEDTHQRVYRYCMVLIQAKRKVIKTP